MFAGLYLYCRTDNLSKEFSDGTSVDKKETIVVYGESQLLVSRDTGIFPYAAEKRDRDCTSASVRNPDAFRRRLSLIAI